MTYKVFCEITFPSLDITLDITVPIDKTVEYVCQMFEKIMKEETANTYQSKDTSILINKVTGTIYDRNVLVADTDIRNGTKLAYY